MKLKLSKNQMNAIKILLAMLIECHNPTNMADNLVDTLVRQVLEKVSIKLIKSVSEGKVKHSLQLTDAEAMAVHIYLGRLVTDEIRNSYQYEAIVCDSVVRDIDREYA
jgi:hypothetical protein